MKIDKIKYVKFIVFSVIGIVMFLIPVSHNGSVSVVTGVLADYIMALLGDILMWFAVAVIVVCSIMSLIGSLLKPKFITEHEFWRDIFCTTPLYYISRVLGAVIAVMCAFNVGPEFVRGEATGQTILGIANPLVAILFAVSYFVPFLTDYGLMEYVGVFLRKLTRPLFKLPGRSAINLITSWLGASNAAVIITNTQYEKGYYTKRETAIIITAFSAVNIPFCLVVAQTVAVTDYFVQGYLTVCVVGVILAIITPRLWPLRSMPDTYYKKKNEEASDEIVPEGVKPHRWAIKLASDKTDDFNVKTIITEGTKMIVNVYLTTLPIVFAWGTTALIIVEYTPVLDWISYPFGWYLEVLGVDMAFEAAPATLGGFIDMFIPSLLVINIPSAMTRWIICVLSLTQIIFMTEVGILAMQTDVGLNVKNLFVIFLERTIIAIPLIVLAANLIF